MCGLIASNDKRVSSRAIELALYKMQYRGTVEPCFETNGHYHVGHVSLPMCSLDPYEYHQPLNFVAFTGEIFNYHELDPTSTGDVRMIRNLIVDNPLDKILELFHKFDGFWNVAFIREKKLIAITDYLSQKPLYYRTDLNVVASEIDCLVGLAPSEYDPIFFSNIQKWGYDPTGNTPYKNIKQMPAGSVYIDGVISSYWDWSKISAPYVISTGISQATSKRMHVARPQSLLLSGGLDSSIIYAVTQELGYGDQIKVFHVDNDESDYADMMTTNRTNITLDEVTDSEAVTVHQSPVDLGSVKPQLALAKSIAKEGYHMVLTGDGADELFGGYRRAKEYDSQMSDVFQELPYYHLPRLDRTMMRHTIEVRSPFLAPYIVKYAMELPYAERIDKKHLKDAYRHMLPKEIIDRPKVPLKTKAIRNDLLSNTQSNIKLFKEYRND